MPDQRFIENKAIRVFYNLMALSGVLTALINQGDGMMGGLERAIGFAQFFIYMSMCYLSRKNLVEQSIVMVQGAMILQGLMVVLSVYNNFIAHAIDLNLVQSDILGGIIIIWALYHRQRDLRRLLATAQKIQDIRAK
jgi:hypothetical protein|nr:MAG TPA: hypothetical protein [Caudoviricetes sp.]